MFPIHNQFINHCRIGLVGVFILGILSILGSGGGGGNSTDTTPPTVTQTVPADGVSDVETGTVISVSFNETMASSTINDTNFVVKDASDNVISGAITESNTTYTFTPDNTLSYNTTYTAAISTNVTDAANNNLVNIYTWSFSTMNLPGATTPATLNVTNLTDTSVTMNGMFTNPLNYTTTVWFEYGLTTSYGTSTPSSVYAAASDISFTSDVAGLVDRTTYHYRIVTQNQDGTFYGEDKEFKTYITPTTIAINLNAPNSLHLHNNELYWVEIYNDAVRKVSITGGTVATEATSTMGGNSAYLDLDFTDSYWTDTNTIWTKPIGIGAVSSVATSLGYNIYDVKVYLTDLYVYDYAVGAIKKVAISDGSISSIITAANIYLFEIDSSGIYWTDALNGKIIKASHDGSSVVTLAVNLNSPKSLILETGQLYWAENNAIKTMSTSGGQLTTIVNNVSPETMTKDLTHIYFSDSGSIKSVNISTGELTTLVVEQTVRNIVVDTNYIYWLVPGNQYYPPMGEVRMSFKSY